MNRHLLLLLAICLFVIGCKGNSAAGKYHIEQDSNAIGIGAEKFTLDLNADKTFKVEIGQLTMVDGTWSEADGKVTFSKGQGVIGTTYRLDGTKLIPQQDGKDVTSWRFVR